MSDIDNSVIAYQQAIANLPQAKDQDASLKVLGALLARDRVAQELALAEMTPEILAAIAEADTALKTQAKKISEVVGSAKLVDWREARLPPVVKASELKDEAWWWSLDLRGQKIEWWKTALNYFLWVCIVISLSFVIESLRRFLSGEVGVLGTVLQGLVTLLVGGTLLEVAKQVTAGRSGTGGGWNSRSFKRRSAFTSLLIGVALVMWFLLPKAVEYYSNLGVSNRQEGKLSDPISHYQRAISLEPSDAIGHYNLARAHEAIMEYDKAEAEYKSAIRWGDDQAVFYDGLAHLLIVKNKDYVRSLKLLDAGLDKLENQKKANEFQSRENDHNRIKVSLLRNRAWAYFGLGYFTQAEDDLRTAIEANPRAAAPHCLLGQVLEKKPDAARDALQAFTDCITFSHEQRDRIEAEWFAHAQERLNEEDKKNQAGTKESMPGRERKKP